MDDGFSPNYNGGDGGSGGNYDGYSDPYGGNYITIEDDEGQEFELEQLDTLEYNGSDYSLFLPADMSEDDPDYGYIILRIEEENGEEVYCSVDEEDELVAVYDLFMERIFGDEDNDENDGE